MNLDPSAVPPVFEQESPPPDAAGAGTLPAVAPRPLQPVAVAERIVLLDVLRGAALLGILIANMRGFNTPGAIYGDPTLLFPGALDGFAQALIDIFVQGKFILIFSFLFGLGFAVQMDRAAASGRATGWFYPRRLAILLGLGLLHGVVLWWGDILTAYAMMGFLLLTFRRASQRTLLRWIAGHLAALLLVIAGALLFFAFRSMRPESVEPPEARRAPQELARVVTVLSQGTPAAMLVENAKAWAHQAPMNGAVLIFGFVFLGGLWLWRSRMLENLAAHAAALRLVALVALPLGIALQAIARVTDAAIETPRTVEGLVMAGGALFGAPLMSAGYASLVALAWLRGPAWQRRLLPFANVGRMALTNYLTQSLVCVAGYRLSGLYGRVGPAWGLVPTFALYAAQVWFSRWWLARFRFGPVEWVWRSLSYGRLGRLRRGPGDSDE